MRTPALYYCCLAALCAVSLFIGMAHAADLTPAAKITSQIHGFGSGHYVNPQLNLSCLEQQGVTMTDIQTARMRNDTASIRAWSDACRQSIKGITGNATYRLPQTLRNGIAPVDGNGMKVFPARNQSVHSSVTGMTPGFFGGNLTHKYLGANSTLPRLGSLPTGTIFHNALNGSNVGQKKATHLNRNTTVMKPFPDKHHRFFLNETLKGSRSGSTSAVNAIPLSTQPTI